MHLRTRNTNINNVPDRMLQSYCTAVFQTHTTTETKEKVDGNPQTIICGAQDITLKILQATRTSVSVFSVSQDSKFFKLFR